MVAEIPVAESDTDDYQGLTRAGVFLLIYEKNGSICVLFNKRTDLVEHHKGEISFPGGASDYSDSDILDTALRETYEEMGVSPDDVDVLCRLDRVVTRSGFVITPFVGIIPSHYTFEISQIEVAEILEVPLDLLMNQYSRNIATRADAGAYKYGEHIIWGATATILTRFLELL